MELTRRSLLATLASSAAFAAAKTHAFDRPLGAELYTVRNVLPKDASGTLKEIAAIGYKEVECSTADLNQYAPLYKEFGLTAPAIHADTNQILNGGFQQTIGDAKNHGIKYVVMPYIAPNLRGSLDGYRQIADKMNQAGEQCAKAGLQFCYHNHAFEFGGKPGERAWDVFMQKWDKKLVQLELDVFWLSIAGNIPSDIIRQLSGRVPLVHLKDKAFGAAVQYNEKVNPSDFRAVGTGTLDFVSILKACEKAGTQYYFVEQDQTPGPPLDSLRLSYNNLRKLKI
jgi:sugar phosphate isomerase/epimerase